MAQNSVSAMVSSLTLDADPVDVGLVALLKSGDLVDVELLVDGTSFKAHKVVLAACSPVFRAMFCGSFKEGEAAKADAVAQVDVVGASKEAFEIFLELLYKSAARSANDWGGLELEVLELADRYLVEPLRARCEQRLLQLDAIGALRVLRQADRPVLTSKIREQAVESVLRGWGRVEGSAEWADFQAACPVLADTLRAAKRLTPNANSSSGSTIERTPERQSGISHLLMPDIDIPPW